MRISEKLNVTLILYAYAITLGALYLFAFWRPFGFSIFPYMSLQDYISAPLNGIVLLLIFPLVSYPMFLLLTEFNTYVLKLCLFGLVILYNGLAVYYLIGDVNLLLQASFQYQNENSILILARFLFFQLG